MRTQSRVSYHQIFSYCTYENTEQGFQTFYSADGFQQNLFQIVNSADGVQQNVFQIVNSAYGV